ncbi:response regulator [Paenibacillus nasutitermitis]|uniref:Response regulator n=1 Tax=Paenibacillus nasutitermitis TaxID=1652958 RepID=A0A916Z2R4_9BACL|nr:response regulator [Paenibacillus nasutitermitis]GGD73448.1 hypothetical protein GCM10010911_34170 [Paenibacillus nasutitermitis]
MCRVLLVDDEFMARAGLRATFDWEGNGYTLVGEAANGMRAMQWIESREVDILITDIAMPVMDGLELMRRTRELCPWVKVLLLSCHSDFDYVREGIRLGASDYILKPTLNADSLKTILDKMREELREEEVNRQLLDKYRNKQVAEQQEELEKVLIQSVYGKEEALKSIHAAIGDMASGYYFAVIRLHGVDGFAAESEDQLIGQISQLKAAVYEQLKVPIAAIIHPDLLIAVIPGHAFQSGGLRESIRAIMGDREYDHGEYTAGISRIYEDPLKIQSAFSEARLALEDTFFYGIGSIVQAVEQIEEEVFPSRDLPNKMHLLKEALAAARGSEAKEQVHRIMDLWSPAFKTKQQVIAEAEQILSLLTLSKHSNIVMVPYIRQLSKLDFAPDIKRHVEACFSETPIEKDQDMPDITLHGRIIVQAVQFMTEHFTESISLQQVADEVNVSRNYFSEMFKRETGKNFIEYLITLRVKRAKELLSESTLRVYEVAEQSGFNDVKHFSKQFKKIVGLTPAEFHGQPRKSGGQANCGKQDTFS